MELPVFNREDGKFLFNVQFKEDDRFAELKNLIEEKTGIEPKDQKIFLSIPLVKSLDVRLDDDSVLKRWPLSDARSYKIFADLPHAADKVTFESPRILVVGSANNRMTVKPLDCAAGPVEFQCNDNTLNILLDTTPSITNRTHRVLQFKDERPGMFVIKDKEPGFEVYFRTNDGIEDENPLVPVRVDLSQTRTWTEFGSDIFLIACDDPGNTYILPGIRQNLAVGLIALGAYYGEPWKTIGQVMQMLIFPIAHLPWRRY